MLGDGLKKSQKKIPDICCFWNRILLSGTMELPIPE